MRKLLVVLGVLALHTAPHPAFACGDSEAPSMCGDGGGESDAKWMLARVATALKADHDKALRQFARGEGGFRTMDTYVFCVGPEGVMSAHPNPILQGQNVADLHDQTGNYFIRTMMDTAKPGAVSQIRYLFPRPGGSIAQPKTTFYTRVDNQVCGVGVYDGEEPVPAKATPQERAATLQQKLSGEIQPAARADWEAYLEAVKERDTARDTALTRLRESLEAAQLTLAGR